MKPLFDSSKFVWMINEDPEVGTDKWVVISNEEFAERFGGSEGTPSQYCKKLKRHVQVMFTTKS